MRVRVAYTMKVDDDFRRALSCYDGDHGKRAPRSRLVELAEYVGKSEDADIMDEWAECQVCYPYSTAHPEGTQ